MNGCDIDLDIEGTGLCFGVDYLWMSLEKAFGQRAAPRSLGRERGGGGGGGTGEYYYRAEPASQPDTGKFTTGE